MLLAITKSLVKKEHAEQNYSYAWNNAHLSVGRSAENEEKCDAGRCARR